jgi:hypothetical protein
MGFEIVEGFTSGLEPVRTQTRVQRPPENLRELPQNIFTGRGKDIDLYPIADTLARARTSPAKQDVWESLVQKGIIPGGTIREDEEGRLIVGIGGGDQKREFYINRPGVSAADISGFMQEAIADIGLSRIGSGSLGAVFGGPGRVIGAGAGTAGGSLAMDVGAMLQGSKKGVDATRALIMGGLGFTGEAALPLIGLGTRIVKSLLSKPKIWNPKTGKITERGREFLREQGIDNPTDDYLRALEANLSTARNSDEAARLMESQTLDVPVPMTRGDITRDVTEQAFESAAERGAYGQQAADILSDFRAGQQGALTANVTALQGRLAGEPVTYGSPGMSQAQKTAAMQEQLGPKVLDDPVRAAESLQQRLAKKRDDLKIQQKAAFQEGRDGNAALGADDFEGVGTSISMKLQSDPQFGFNPRISPKTFGILDDISKAGQDLRGGAMLGMDGQIIRPQTIPFQKLETYRKQLSNISREVQPDMTATVEAATAMSAIRLLDKQVDDFITQSLIKGDGVGAIVRGRKHTRDLKRNYSEDKLIREIVSERDKTLVREPSEIIKLLFGSKGVVSKRGVANSVRKIKTLVGEDSAEWAGLRQAALLRWVQKAEGDLSPNEIITMSGDKFFNAVKTSLRDSPELVRALFSAEEVGRIQQLAKVARRATNRVQGGVNYSNTLTNFMALLGPAGRTLAQAGKTIPFVKAMPEAYYGAKASAAVGGRGGFLGGTQSRVPPGLYGGLTAGGLGPVELDIERAIQRRMQK